MSYYTILPKGLEHRQALLAVRSCISYFVTMADRNNFKEEQLDSVSHSEEGRAEPPRPCHQDHETKAVHTGVSPESERTRIYLPGPSPSILLGTTRPHLLKVSQMPSSTEK